MKATHIKGKKVADIMLYTLSTCIWCKKVKALLTELGVEYFYIDVDTITREEKEQVSKEIEKWNPAVSFPTIVINNKEYILGYQPEEIKEKLKL
ncbi:MAG: NrdH-redoxin [Candidatus Firestonebacteria bacterium RIFOXYC2_FULL_39_67]|nr:MAG: NrdH-redoxin [Candidatus Firestonebacteria bacterium RIFOXYD2_FULL_39_29]OGF55049.1 MAG: NrdH-redoxin [Candidatus Firestonebacteria bacterium RifOxyC12_full_39_7]OGF56408.1 MAG: NrdH-redoxin [Candidatus Firestonebacteria bacterium RIFOXYC2_FULL_39_67]